VLKKKKNSIRLTPKGLYAIGNGTNYVGVVVMGLERTLYKAIQATNIVARGVNIRVGYAFESKKAYSCIKIVILTLILLALKPMLRSMGSI